MGGVTAQLPESTSGPGPAPCRQSSDTVCCGGPAPAPGSDSTLPDGDRQWGGGRCLRDVGRPSPMWSRSSPHGSWKPIRTWPNFHCPRLSCVSSRPGSPYPTLASPMSWSGTARPSPLCPPLLPRAGDPEAPLPALCGRPTILHPRIKPQSERPGRRAGGQESRLPSQLCRSPVPPEAAVCCEDLFPACRDSQAADDGGPHRSCYRKAWTVCLMLPKAWIMLAIS